MNITRGFAALLVVTGCATARPTFVTRHGLRIFDKTNRTLTAQQLEPVIDAMLELTGNETQLAGIDAILVSEWIEIPQMSGKVTRSDGFTNPLDGQLVAAVFSDCLYLSGLVHELAHVVHDRPTGVPDWTHDDKPFWEKVEAKEIELRARCTQAQREADAAARGQPLPAAVAEPAADPPTEPKAAEADAPDRAAPSDPASEATADEQTPEPESGPTP
jgi:hypothetical protein